MKRLTVLILLVGCGSPGPNMALAPDGANDADAEPVTIDAAPAVRPPILFVHGIKGDESEFVTLANRLESDGWHADRLIRFTFDDPEWGCNIDNAGAIAERVQEIRTRTGSETVDIIAHSMGSLSSRYFGKNLAGHESVRILVTLGGMHQGLASSCSPDFPLKPCVWKELCQSGEFIEQLNQPPTTPGPAKWVSIFGSADTTVPPASSQLDGAENIEMPGVEHAGDNGLLEDMATYEQIRRVLQ